jgi:hypothetical protein
VSLVAKVKSKADDLSTKAKARYADSDAMQKASKQAGQAASQVADRLKDLAGKTTSAVKDARTKGATHR